MNTYLVTVKLPRGHAGPHDPRNKVTGTCPLGGTCTDVTGEHHTALVRASNMEVAMADFSQYHITRVEELA